MNVGGEKFSESASTVKSAYDGKGRGWVSDLIGLLVLAVIALFVGGLVNASRVEPLPWVYRSREQVMSATVARLQEVPRPPPTANQPSAPTHEIRLEEFQPMVAERTGLVIDARPAVFYRESHVPGALSLPRETFAEDYPRMRDRLEAYRDRLIAVYCSGPDCPDSQLVADALTKLGYQRLVIYTSGWDEWSKTGLPQESAATAP